MKKNIKLYNMVFPTYVTMFFPPMIFLTIIGDFLIDTVVTLILCHVIFRKTSKDFYVKTIYKAWGLGFLADYIGAVICFIPPQLAYNIFVGKGNPYFVPGRKLNPVITFLISDYNFTIIGFIVAIIFIFIFDFFITFNNRDLGLKLWQRLICALLFATLTAPITFFM